jgi:Putative prokaryotic signal transducing protein
MTDTGNPPSPDELEEVFSSADSMQVEMARDLLQSSGMECFVFDESSSRMLGSTAAVTARLMVHAADAEEARAALKDLGFET